MKCIAYRGGYKYQLKESYTLDIAIKPAKAIETTFLQLDTAGKLTIKDGYAWDGPSGPTMDTLTFMRGSLVHDALYQLMREKHLDHDTHRKTADRILWQLCREDGMWAARAWWVYWAVRWFADPAADPASTKPLTHAPKGCEKGAVKSQEL
jgi:hypothetical protein